MKIVLSMLLALSVIGGCGYPKPKLVEGSTSEYKLYYCKKEQKCFDAAEKMCPNGYTITKYGNIRPEKFVCK